MLVWCQYESQVLEGGKIVYQVAVQGSWDGGTGTGFRVRGRAVAAVPGPALATPRWRDRWGERWRCPEEFGRIINRRSSL